MMMIGGSDVVIPTRLTAELALDVSARVLLHHWPLAVFQDVVTGNTYPDHDSIVFRGLSELLVYENQDAFDAWEQTGAEEENAHTMVHLLARPGELTVVADDPAKPSTKALVNEIRRELQNVHPAGEI